MKMPYEVGYWKLNEMRGREVSAWDKNIDSWISEVKQYEKGGLTLNVYIYLLGGGGGGWKIGHKIRMYQMDDPKQVLWNIFLCIGLVKYTRTSPPARKV